MSELRPLEPRPADPAAPPVAGPWPELRWIDIEALRIDMSYQRPVETRGRRSINRIVAEFDWACFAPVIVAPTCAPGGPLLYAVIDGQHRATAAAERGLTQVPCWVVEIDGARQAGAFAAINGQVTAMTPMQIWKAARAGGEPWAVELQRIAEAENVRILAYPVQRSKQQPGDTMAAGQLRQALYRHGPEIVQAALACITRTRHNLPGALGAPVVMGLIKAIAAHPEWLAGAGWRAQLLAAADSMSLGDVEGMRMRDVAITLLTAMEREMRRVRARSAEAGGTQAEPLGFDAQVAELTRRGMSEMAIATRLRARYAEVAAARERMREHLA